MESINNEATQTKNEVLFFTYGTLRRDYGNYQHCLKGSEDLGNFETEPVYTLFDGGFPIVERGGTTSVKGELHRATNESQITRVFGLEGCSSREKGNPRNWYDIDYIDTPHGKAVIFVMDKGKSGRSGALSSGIWGYEKR